MKEGGSSSVNGTLILVFGILGIVCCGIFAPIAWVMGNNALTSLNQGGGDESQRGLVVAGRILGIIGTVLLILSLVWTVFFGGLAVLSGLAGGGR